MGKVIERFWKWELEQDITIKIPDKFKLPDFENEWITIKDNFLHIRKGYSWDGCSPKHIILGKVVIGVWDGNIDETTGKPVCYRCSLIHDVLYQFNVCTRKTIDRIFLHFGKEFFLINVYYCFVRTFGWVLWNRQDKNNIN